MATIRLHDELSDVFPVSEISITVDGEPMTAWLGQTVAAVLMQHDRLAFRETRNAGRPRGYYCGMGICYDCVVEVDGHTQRACMTRVRDGMVVKRPTKFTGKKR